MIPLALISAILSAPDPVLRLRGGEDVPSGLVAVAVGDAGVLLGPSEQNDPAEIGKGRQPVVKNVLTWDRVARVSGWLEDPAKPYTHNAEQAWRARTRLERGDWVSAEPLLDALFESARRKPGPSAAVIDEALARARVRRGAHVLAVEPFLAFLQSSSTSAPPAMHANWASEAGLGVLVDPTTQLAPALPPIWVRLPAVEAMASAGTLAAGWDSATTGAPLSRVTMLAMLYLESAKFEADMPASLPPIKPADPGVQLMHEVVAARIGTSEQRAAARKLLRDRIRAAESTPAPSQNSEDAAPIIPPWTEAWARVALGRSLVREPGLDDRQAGILQLLHVPARFARSQPYLAGLALAEASLALRSMGDAAGADELARELVRQFPSHPILDWPPIRDTIPANPPPSSSPTPANDAPAPQTP